MPNTLDDFFEGYANSRLIFDALLQFIRLMGPVQLKVSQSQVAFRRRKAFAWAWIPGQYLSGKHAPLVLTVSLPYRHPSTRWKEIVEPSPGRFTHHLELYSSHEIDDEVMQWLKQAWNNAG